jgi:hypothetical protein
MAKITLKLYEFYNLEAELNGVTNQQTAEKISKGLLAEKLKLTTKYWLTELVKKVLVEKESCEAIKQSLIKKHGTPDEDGNVSISMYANVIKDENGTITSAENNPQFVEFQTEFNTLLSEDKELEYKEFKLEDFEDVITEGAYPTFFKLVTVEE